MSVTRKEFLRQGAASLGRAALDFAGLFGGAPAPAPPREEAPLEPGAHLVARPQGSECLAGSCGCLSCLERCEPEAITVVIGAGIRVDAERCTGCGVCVGVCPTTPRSLELVPREAPSEEGDCRDSA